MKLITVLLLASFTVVYCRVEFCGNNPADVLFLLDSSNSIWGPNYDRQIRFVHDVVDMFEIAKNVTRVGVTTFSQRPTLQFNLDRYTNKEDLLDAIEHIPFRPATATNTGAALKFLRRRMLKRHHGARKDVSQIVIVITDGQSSNMYKTLLQATYLKRTGVHLFAIGIGVGVDERELRGIASHPKDNYFFRVDSYAALDSIKKILAIRTCTVTTRAPPTTTTTTTTTTTPTTTTTTPTTTTTSLLEVAKKVCSDKRADIVFAIDSSISVNNNQFYDQVGFFDQFVDSVDIAQNKTRVGLLLYSDQVQNMFDMSKHDDAERLHKAVRSLKQNGGNYISTSSPIRHLRTKSFRRSNSRRDAPQIGVILTSGQSFNPKSTEKEAERARKTGISLFSVGIGPDVSSEELQTIGGSNRNVFQIDDFNQLQDIVPKLMMEICQVEVNEIPIADQPCGYRQDADIVFMMDVASAGRRNTDKVMNFMKGVVSQLEVDNNHIQVGLMAEEECTDTGFSLGQHRNRLSLSNAFTKQHTFDYAKMMKNMRRHAFRRSKGGRKDAKKVAVLVVDGDIENPQRAINEAERMRLHGVEVFVVAVGDEKPQEELALMCDDPHQKYFYHVKDYDQLHKLKDRLMTMMCDEL